MSNTAVFVGYQPQLPFGSLTVFFLPLPNRSLKKPLIRGAFFCLSRWAAHIASFVYRT
ncbi:hypothetical protein [Musicola keenii]|uniref:hypothetical protein n=1 Tax=Musicola keenii TaxID=2884250 RepID=UPI0017825D81|nr:hypothetical protein [Musicola keenii]